MFVPLAGLIKLVQALWNTIQFVKAKLSKIQEVMTNILNAVGPAAQGSAGPATKSILAAMISAVPLLIGWFAKLVGLGKMSKHVQSMLEKIQALVNKVIDFCIDKVMAGINWLKAKLGGGN